MLPLLAVFAAAFALSLWLTHRVRAWALRAGVVDEPDEQRRLHAGAVPSAGGVAVVLSTVTVAGAVLLLAGPTALARAAELRTLTVLAGAGGLVFVLGFYDDVRGLHARTKFVVEVAIALGIFTAGVRIDGVSLLGGGHWAFPWWLGLGVTTLWVVGITNAFNLIDGSDGVAAGAALFASAVIALISLLNGDPLGTVVALTLAGATLGFLFFNFPPASIFLGDSGSLFLGFSLATLGIVTAQKASTALAVAIPVVSFGLPIVDTGLAMARRYLRGDPIFDADRGHIHHRLRDLGHSPRTVALLLYAICGVFALLALLLTRPSGSVSGIVLVVAGAVGLISIQRLKIPELVELRRVMDRGLRQRAVIGHNVRIRRAIVRLRLAKDSAALLEALGAAFEAGEFERAEMWLPEQAADALAGRAAIRPDKDGYRWSWVAGPAAESRSELWELRLPFHGANGRPVGRLSLWRSRDGAHLLTDVRLIAVELIPELQRALTRLRSEEASDVVMTAERVVVAADAD